MRILLLVLLAGCQEQVRTQTFALPLDVEPGTIFSIADVGPDMNEDDRYGRIGDVERLGGPDFEVQAQSLLIAQFLPTDFNGVRGPELVHLGGGPRDGLDAVRLPPAVKVYEVVEGQLEEAEQAIDQLRVPCDAARASTRPSVETDPAPRCPMRDAAVVVTCDDLTRGNNGTRAVEVDGTQYQVVVEQQGCRVDFSCLEGQPCADVFPLYAILPPYGAARGDDALMALQGVDHCPRTGGEEAQFDCGGRTLVFQ